MSNLARNTRILFMKLVIRKASSLCYIHRYKYSRQVQHLVFDKIGGSFKPAFDFTYYEQQKSTDIHTPSLQTQSLNVPTIFQTIKEELYSRPTGKHHSAPASFNQDF